jgi:predicted NBD/HSP70 family sugar kinase
MTRADLARELEVSQATVGSVAKELIDLGLVAPLEDYGPSTGGRPGQLLTLVGRAGRAVGVKVSLDHLAAVDMRLDGAVVRSEIEDFDARVAPVEALARLAAYLDGFIAGGEGEVPLLGVGICVPGVVGEPDLGLAEVPAFGWASVPVGRYLRGVLGVPVLVENGVKALAFSELLYGHGRKRKSFAVLTIGRGVGFAAVAGREVQRGAFGAAGEIGHTVVEPGGPPCQCGARGCLESFASDEGLVGAARSAGVLRSGEGTARLAQLAAAGDPAALQVYERAATVLGRFLAGPLTVLDPEVVVIAGEGSSAWHHWDEPFRRALRERLPAGWHEVVVELSSWLDGNWARGAAAIVLATLFDQRAVAGRQRARVLSRLRTGVVEAGPTDDLVLAVQELGGSQF